MKWAVGDTDVYRRGLCAVFIDTRGFAAQHWSLQTIHRVNTVKHCTMPRRTARSRHGPRMETRWCEKLCTSATLGLMEGVGL